MSLSNEDNWIYIENDGRYFKESAIKEFIKELKSEFNEVETQNDYSGSEVRYIIDKLAGDKLI